MINNNLYLLFIASLCAFSTYAHSATRALRTGAFCMRSLRQALPQATTTAARTACRPILSNRYLSTPDNKASAATLKFTPYDGLEQFFAERDAEKRAQEAEERLHIAYKRKQRGKQYLEDIEKGVFLIDQKPQFDRWHGCEEVLELMKENEQYAMNVKQALTTFFENADKKIPLRNHLFPMLMSFGPGNTHEWLTLLLINYQSKWNACDVLQVLRPYVMPYMGSKYSPYDQKDIKKRIACAANLLQHIPPYERALRKVLKDFIDEELVFLVAKTG